MNLLNNIIIGTCFCFTGLLIRSTRTTITSAIMASTTSTSTNQESQATEPQEYISGTHSVAFVTTPNEQSAKKIAHALVKDKLAACVNIVPQITSIYDWEGKINEDSEVLLMIKTKTERMAELIKFVRENHPYSVAEVISLPIENGNFPYLDWISKTVK